MTEFTYLDVERMETATKEEFDALHFGAIKLDKTGVIIRYNAYEGRIAGRNPEDVVGKNFFTEIAPCTNVREFAGRFREGVESGKLYITFPYRFRFPGNYVDVEITMQAAPGGESAWIFVRDKPNTV